jgi:hypothetical protein
MSPLPIPTGRLDVKRLVLACIVGLAGVASVFAQEGTLETQWGNLSQDVGKIVRPTAEVTLYQGAPSRWTGNLFNSKAEIALPESELRITDVEIYPGLGGNQVWIEVKSSDSGANSCVDSSCWAFYGTVDQSAGGITNNKFELARDPTDSN